MTDVPAQPTADPQFPVVLVSWDDAQAFLGKLSALLPGLRAGLPSEAQWEYACRAGTIQHQWNDGSAAWIADS